MTIRGGFDLKCQEVRSCDQTSVVVVVGVGWVCARERNEVQSAGGLRGDRMGGLVWAGKLLVFVLIILSAILGNSLVVAAVWRVRRLRSLTNYFVVSLAAADTLVALCAMTFNASQTLNDGVWPFGPFLCDLWTSLDVYFCTTSILHLCSISVDRYYAICRPLEYPLTMTASTVRLMLAGIWLLPAAVSFLPIFTGFYGTGTLGEGRESCDLEVNGTYALLSSAISFWIPAIVMVITYWRIYREAAQQEHILYRTKVAAALLNKHLQISEIGIRVQSGAEGPIGPEISASSVQSMKREHKAARTLGIIMGVFVLCWLPFFSWYLVTALCGHTACPTPPWVVDLVFWIGYANSSLNPVIYAYFNREFRNAFKGVLAAIFCGRCCLDPPVPPDSINYREGGLTSE